MSNQNLLAAILVACLLAVSIVGIASVADAAPARKSTAHATKKSRPLVVNVYRRYASPPMYVPVGPSYLFYDYPYYYSRGFYPTHIGPHYIFYGPQY